MPVIFAEGFALPHTQVDHAHRLGIEAELKVVHVRHQTEPVRERVPRLIAQKHGDVAPTAPVTRERIEIDVARLLLLEHCIQIDLSDGLGGFTVGRPRRL